MRQSELRKPGLVLHDAFAYDFLVWIFTRGGEITFRKMIMGKAELQLGETVLDIGCGTGSLAIAAKRKIGPAGSMHGIDASPQMIARAKKKAKSAGVDVSFKVALVQELPFADGHFDVVLSTMMFHHLSRTARQQCATQIKRVLKPGGKVLVVDFAPAEQAKKGLLDHLHRRHGHVSLQDILAPLEDAGLGTVETGGLGLYDLQFVVAEAPAPVRA
ncbi:MAG TPA: methyltransferase domain-containing protein [Alphaproteobacteria bacterium]|nr:methyltransferase domain-containing protein [Alphaproteobacteria bacterium]